MKCMKTVRHNVPSLLLPVMLAFGAAQPFATAAEQPESPAVIQRLLGDLKSDDWILQASALRQLGELKQPAAAATILEIAQTTTNDWLRGQALLALARLKPQELLSKVGTLLTNAQPAMRILGLRAIELSREPAGLPAAKAAVNDPDSLVRWTALAAQAALEGAATWPDLEPALKAAKPEDELPALREIARALAYVGSPAAWERIDQLLERHRQPDHLQPLLRGLTDVHDTQLIPRLVHIQQLVQGDAVSDRLCQRALRRYTPAELTAALSQIFQGAATNDLPAAARVAGALCPGPELGELIARNIGQHPDAPPAILGACLEALAHPEMMPARYQALYQRCLTVPDPAIRRAAVHGLEKCAGVDLFELLGPSLHDDSPEVRQAVLTALGALPPSRAPADLAGYIRKYLQDDLSGTNATRRADAARALSGVCSVQQLVELARPQGYVADWMVLGAFPSDEKNAGFQQKQPPEDKVDFSQTFKTKYGWTGEGADPNDKLEREIKWQRTSLLLANGMLRLGYVMPPAPYGVCFAVADVRADKARTIQATLAVDNCAILWLNGQQRAQLEPSKSAEAPVVTQEVALPLAAGVNRIMIKVGNLGDDWSVSLRFHEDNGAAVVLPSAFAPEEKRP